MGSTAPPLSQEEYFRQQRPDSEAARLGLYGLSAGEAFRGRGYAVHGSQWPGADLIHPHYLLMSAQLRPAEEAFRPVQALEARGLMPPWGLVENVRADLTEYSPAVGSLNAAFECLGAYHAAVKALGRPDEVYEAARACAPLARAAATFYPK